MTSSSVHAKIAEPLHHPEPEELLEYASGSSPAWLTLMIACHLTLRPRCREEVALLDDLGGVLLELDDAAGGHYSDWTAEAAASAADLSQSAQFAHTATQSVSEPTLPAGFNGMVPRPLHAYFTDSAVRWRFLVPGVKPVPLTSPNDDVLMRLVEFRPGSVIPKHGHTGIEWLLILSGDIGDSASTTRYGRSDVYRNDIGGEHYQDVGPDEPCIAIAANQGPLVPLTFAGRLVAKFFKI